MVTLLDNGINTNFRHISNTNKQKQPKKNPEKKLVKSINVKIFTLTKIFSKAGCTQKYRQFTNNKKALETHILPVHIIYQLNLQLLCMSAPSPKLNPIFLSLVCI